jgi:transcriptional regulator with XRE-family HTH domain
MGISQAELSRKAGLALSTIENAECRGYTGSVSTLVSIAAAMGGEVVVKFPEDGE